MTVTSVALKFLSGIVRSPLELSRKPETAAFGYPRER
jgi:hypothetical protein